MKLIRLFLALPLLFLALFSQDTSTAPRYKSAEAAQSPPTVLLTIDTPSPLSASSTDVLVSVDKQSFVPVSLQSASSAPVDLILVVDSSSSAMRSPLRMTELSDVSRFITGLRNSGIAVRAGVVEFTATARIVQNLTDDSIESSLEHLSPGGGSTLYDALFLATSIAQQCPASSRRLILLVSDGEDNLSNATPDEVVQAAVRSVSPIYALSLGEPARQYAPMSGRGDQFLRFVSAQSGGLAYFPKNQAQVTEALAAIRSEMQKQYFATVSTTKGHHKLRFKTSIPHGVIRGISAITVN